MQWRILLYEHGQPLSEVNYSTGIAVNLFSVTIFSVNLHSYGAKVGFSSNNNHTMLTTWVAILIV